MIEWTTELTTSNSHRPIHVALKPSGILVTDDGTDIIEYDREEIKELRDFLNQLRLED